MELSEPKELSNNCASGRSAIAEALGDSSERQLETGARARCPEAETNRLRMLIANRELR